MVRCIDGLVKLGDIVPVHYKTISFNDGRIEFKTRTDEFGDDSAYLFDRGVFQNSVAFLVHELSVLNASVFNYMSARQMNHLPLDAKKMFHTRDVDGIETVFRDVTSDNAGTIIAMQETIRTVDAREHQNQRLAHHGRLGSLTTMDVDNRS